VTSLDPSNPPWTAALWRWAPLVLWLGVIFYLSSPEGAFTNTSRIIGPILQFLFPDMSEAARMVIHGYVRKAAHFTEYAVLAFLAARACVMSASLFLWRFRYLVPLMLVAIVSAADETNQSFLASRTASVYDVLIDIAGGAVMTLLMWSTGRPGRVSDASAAPEESAEAGT
jgi:VanZ family protein